jgi:hypothetical protein
LIELTSAEEVSEKNVLSVSEFVVPELTDYASTDIF